MEGGGTPNPATGGAPIGCIATLVGIGGTIPVKPDQSYQIGEKNTACPESLQNMVEITKEQIRFYFKLIATRVRLDF